MSRYDTVTQAAIDYLSRPGWGTLSRAKPLEEAIEKKHPGAIERARTKTKKDAFEKKFLGPVPSWAKRYVNKYARASVGTLRIRVSRTKDYSSGHCWYGVGDIVVTLSKPGSNLVEQQVTVLHELAHALATWDGHGERFYDEWFKMLRAENLYRAGIDTGRFVGVTSLRAAARRARKK